MQIEISDIKIGTRMAFFKEVNQQATGTAFEAEFRHVKSDYLFVVNSSSLYKNFESFESSAQFIIVFEIGPMIYTLAGCLKDKIHVPNLVAIEQTGLIKGVNRRKRDREELLFKVDIFELPPENLDSGNFKILTDDPILSDLTYDISTGGMCIISNSLLDSKFDPYFLVKLTISTKDAFVLPAKLMRKMNLKRTGLGNYEYGFQFIYDNLADAEKRLTKAIMESKLR